MLYANVGVGDQVAFGAFVAGVRSGSEIPAASSVVGSFCMASLERLTDHVSQMPAVVMLSTAYDEFVRSGSSWETRSGFLASR